jgi:DNA-binding transcriptional MocR family regulator
VGRADLPPPFLEQAAVAAFIAQGHFERTCGGCAPPTASGCTRSRTPPSLCGGALRLRPVRTGLHVVADLDGIDAARVTAEARARGVDVMPLSAYFFGRPAEPGALVLGFGAVRPELLREGTERLAAVLESVRRG